jgi:hypothetical protein
VLHEITARIFRTPEGHPFHLYQHQIEALDKACAGESYVVTSGAGGLSDERTGQLAAPGAGKASRGL